MEENCTLLSTDAILGIFEYYYSMVHTPLSMSICVFGLVTNVLNIIVLTRPHMRNPVNLTLTSLSVAQLGLVTMFIFQTVHDILIAQCYLEVNKFWPVQAKLVAINLSLVFHTVALFHTVLIGFMRFIAIKFPGKSRSFVTNMLVIRYVAACYIVVPFVCIPIFLTNRLRATPWTEFTTEWCPLESNSWNGTSFYELDFDLFWMQIGMWEMSIIFKIIPCFLVTTLCVNLLYSMRRQAKKKEKLMSVNQHMRQSGRFSANKEPNMRKDRQKKQQKRVTVLLLTIILLMSAVELPHGILLLLMNVIACFAYSIYNPVGNFINMLTLVYSSINFVLYCTMNTEFRKTFRKLFIEPLMLSDANRETIRQKQALEENPLKNCGLRLCLWCCTFSSSTREPHGTNPRDEGREELLTLTPQVTMRSCQAGPLSVAPSVTLNSDVLTNVTSNVGVLHDRPLSVMLD